MPLRGLDFYKNYVRITIILGIWGGERPAGAAESSAVLHSLSMMRTGSLYVH